MPKAPKFILGVKTAGTNIAVKRYICIILMVAVSAASRFLGYFVSFILDEQGGIGFTYRRGWCGAVGYVGL